MAYDLNVSIQTVSKAYDILARRGHVSGEVGRGTFVKSNGNAVQSPYIAERPSDVIDLSIVTPVCSSLHLDRMKEALHRLGGSMSPSSAFSFRPSTVFPLHQEAAATWHSGLGVQASAQSILVTNGASSALTIVLMSVAPPGSTLAAEAVCYHVVCPLCDYLGFRVRAVDADGDGMLHDALDELCRRERIRGVVLQPNLANPTASVVSDARRIAIAEFARAHDMIIVENDVFGPLMPHRPQPIAAYARERTVYITSFTKVRFLGCGSGMSQRRNSTQRP